MKKLIKILLSSVLLTTSSFAYADLNVLNLSYRTGPFATTGIPLMDGMLDYANMLNERDGGIGGQKYNMIECETGYSTDKGVECYSKLKGDNILTVHPWSTGITLQVIPKAGVDRIPVLSTAYGLSAAADGNTFPWVFNFPATYWDGASIILKYIGGYDMRGLKGKKLVLLHLDHPYGKEPIPLFKDLSKVYGYEFIPIPVGLKEMQNQSAQWLQIRREKPDYVMMWGWGAMNPGAINEAVKTRFDMNRFIGIWWSGHDDDLMVAGQKAKGYKALSWNIPGKYPVIDDIKKYVIDKGLSKIKNADTIYRNFYTRGIIISMMQAEAIRTAQKHFNTSKVNAEQVRWGLENLNITEARLEELGMKGMGYPIKTSCEDHSGHHPAWVLEWNGKEFEPITNLIAPMSDVVRPMLEEAANKYAESNSPWPGRNNIPCN